MKTTTKTLHWYVNNTFDLEKLEGKINEAQEKGIFKEINEACEQFSIITKNFGNMLIVDIFSTLKDGVNYDNEYELTSFIAQFLEENKMIMDFAERMKIDKKEMIFIKKSENPIE